jgi:hypothetical protein
LEGWKPCETFRSEKINQAQLGQLLWAGCGCTPHKTFRYYRYGPLTVEGQGRTIPSASATYTTTIYVIEKKGILKYLNWNNEECVATHSIGRIKKGNVLNMGKYRSGEWVYTRRGELLKEIQSIVPKLPKAPTYIIVASNGRLRPFFSLMEAGYSVLHIILQAEALKMASNIVVTNREQMKKLRSITGLIDTPIALIPLGFAEKTQRSGG